MDDIPSKLITIAGNVIAPIFSQLINMCVLAGCYPDMLKIAQVTPIHKGGNRDDYSHYLPISIFFCQMDHIFEKILFHTFYKYVEIYSVLSPLMALEKKAQHILQYTILSIKLF